MANITEKDELLLLGAVETGTVIEGVVTTISSSRVTFRLPLLPPLPENTTTTTTATVNKVRKMVEMQHSFREILLQDDGTSIDEVGVDDADCCSDEYDIMLVRMIYTVFFRLYNDDNERHYFK
jgi:hypothetical protein